MSEPFRRSPDGIVVDLPRPLRIWLAEAAADAAGDALELGNPVHRRVLGPIDPSADHDDPLVELQRQFGVEGSLGLLVRTADAHLLDEDQAEEWIRGLQLLLAASAARLAVHDEHDLAMLAPTRAEELTTLQALISLLIDAID